LASICIDSSWPMCSQASRVAVSRKRGSWSWQEISPQSRPRTTIDTDIEASVPMLRMYSRWIGDTLRNCACDRSMPAGASAASFETSGTGL